MQDLIEQRLVKELENLELYMRHVGTPTVLQILDDGEVEGAEFYSLSGQTFKWVSVLRAAEVYWNSAGDNTVLFRLREEGTVGDSPQIVVRCWNR